MRMRGRSAFAVLVVLMPTGAQAQDRGRGPVILDVPASTTALAMGNAFQLSGGSSEAIFYNPALLLRATGFGLAAQRFGSRSTALTLSAGTSWWKGAVGVGLQTLSYSTDATTPQAIALGQRDLLTGGATAVSELIATLAYAQEVFGVRWGVAGKLIEQRMAGSKDAVPAVDLGASITLGPITVGLSAQNLGPDLTVTGVETELANRVTAGASLRRRPVGPLDLGASAAITRMADGTVIPAFGGEVAWWPVTGRTFIGRIGVRRVEDGAADEVTFGAAFVGDAITIEYAFQGFDDADGAHRFGVSWR